MCPESTEKHTKKALKFEITLWAVVVHYTRPITIWIYTYIPYFVELVVDSLDAREEGLS